jgi:hypothetical protein
VSIRTKVINYDTGFIPGGSHSRPRFDLDQVKHEIQAIATELHCTAIRISGADPERIAAAGEFAARLDDDYARDESEQVRYLHDLLEIFDAAGVDSAFWFTFAGFGLPHRDEPRADMDLASYGAVAMLDENGATWRPKEVFHALAAAYQ